LQHCTAGSPQYVQLYKPCAPDRIYGCPHEGRHQRKNFTPKHTSDPSSGIFLRTQNSGNVGSPARLLPSLKSENR
jgi:hypothetical protein